jgi:hypothetical protein
MGSGDARSFYLNASGVPSTVTSNPISVRSLPNGRNELVTNVRTDTIEAGTPYVYMLMRNFYRGVNQSLKYFDKKTG